MDSDPRDELEDPELLTEVELLTELIIAANNHAGPLDQETIDRLLGAHTHGRRR